MRPELLFRGGDGTIMAADYAANGTTFVSDKPRPWMTGAAPMGAIRSFDLHPDGTRLAAPPMQAAEDRPDKLAFFFNFFAELKRRAAAGTR